jgi:hypothetical protein
MTVIADTGSNWFWVQGTECLDCGGEESFNRTLSKSYVGISNGSKRASYGSGYVRGIKVEEKVCLAVLPWCETSLVIFEGREALCNPICVDGLSMYYVTSQTGLGSLQADGILGLAPTN